MLEGPEHLWPSEAARRMVGEDVPRGAPEQVNGAGRKRRELWHTGWHQGPSRSGENTAHLYYHCRNPQRRTLVLMLTLCIRHSHSTDR
ncbi:unnamed protein product [Ixodes hexagonus]